MNFFQKQWQRFKEKSLFGKLSDILFIVFIVLMLTSDGRIFFQRMMLKTGLFGSLDKNANTKILEDDWNMQLINAEGEFLTLEDLKGKPVFLNFWATWCPPCNAEMPSIIELMDKKADDVNFAFVTSEPRNKVEAHLAAKGWDIPVYYLQNYAGSKLQATSLPTTFIINQDGYLIHTSGGMRDWSDAEDLFED